MSTMRIGGLATGLDTHQMIQDLMKAHRKPVDRLRQERQVLEWRREDCRSLNSALLSFRNSIVFSMRMNATFQAKSTVSSNASVVTATAPPSAVHAAYNVTVHELATAAYNTSSGRISDVGGNVVAGRVDATQTIWSQRYKFANADFGWDYETTIEEFAADGGTSEFQLTMDEVLRINSVEAGGESYTIYYDQDTFDAAEEPRVLVDIDTGLLTFADAPEAGAVVRVEYDRLAAGAERVFSFQVTTYAPGGEAVTREFTVDSTQRSLNQVLAQVGNARELNLVAFYDAGADKVSISTRHTGNNNPGGAEIGIGTTGFLASVLRLDEAAEQGGTNARLTVNGLETTRPANAFTLNGVNFNLQGTGTAAVSVRGDTEAVFRSIMGFVSAYNNLLDRIHGKLTEERFRDYLPLLDDDPALEKMTDRQIDQWEQKARSGLLRHDAMLSSIAAQIRKDTYSAVSGLSGTMNHPAHIGITAGSLQDRGKLVVDEAKLRNAIEQDAAGVADIFSRTGETAAERGIAHRLYASLDGAVKQLTYRAGRDNISFDSSFLGRSIRETDSRISLMEERLQTLEDRYWKQFTALERAISRMNAQSMWVMQQFGGGMSQG